jgi:hypothetical protein
VRRAVLKSGPVAWPPGQGAGALPVGEGLARPHFLPGMGGWGKVGRPTPWPLAQWHWPAERVGKSRAGEKATYSRGELVLLAEVLQEAGEGSGLDGRGEGRGLHDPEMMAQAEEGRKDSDGDATGFAEELKDAKRLAPARRASFSRARVPYLVEGLRIAATKQGKEVTLMKKLMVREVETLKTSLDVWHEPGTWTYV